MILWADYSDGVLRSESYIPPNHLHFILLQLYEFYCHILLIWLTCCLARVYLRNIQTCQTTVNELCHIHSWPLIHTEIPDNILTMPNNGSLLKSETKNVQVFRQQTSSWSIHKYISEMLLFRHLPKCTEISCCAMLILCLNYIGEMQRWLKIHVHHFK